MRSCSLLGPPPRLMQPGILSEKEVTPLLWKERVTVRLGCPGAGASHGSPRAALAAAAPSHRASQPAGWAGAPAGKARGPGPPSLELVSQLIQDLHGLPVVVQLGIHQGGELAHLLDLQGTSQG